MTTRYTWENVAPSVSPAYGAAWFSTASAVRMRTGVGVGLGIGVSENANSPVNLLAVQVVTDALAAGTIAGTFRMAVMTSNAQSTPANLRVRLRVRADDGTERGTLLDTTDGTALPNGSTQLVTAFEAAMTPVTAVAGDRLVLEYGAFMNNSTTTTRSINFGTWASGAADLAYTDGSATTGRPWFEIVPPANPNPPTGLTQTGTAATTVDVAWTPPATGTAPTGYDLRVNGGAPTDLGLVTTATVTGLTPATSYTVEVRAHNTAGSSAWVSVPATTGVAATGEYAAHLRVGDHSWDIDTGDTPAYGPLAGLRFTWSARQDDGWPTQHDPTVLVFGVIVEAGTDFDDVDQGTPVHFTFTPDGFSTPLVVFGGTVRDLVGRPHPLGMVYNITAVDHLQALREDYTTSLTATNGELTSVVWQRAVLDSDGAGMGTGTRPYLPDPLAGDVPPGNGYLGADLLITDANTWTLLRGIAAAYTQRPDTFPVPHRVILTYTLDADGNLATAHPYEGTWVTQDADPATDLDGSLLVTDAAEWSRPRIEPNRVQDTGSLGSWWERPHTGPDVVRYFNGDGAPFVSDVTDPNWILAGTESPDQWSTALRLLAARDPAPVADWFTLPAAMRVFVSIANIAPRHTPTGSGTMEGLLAGASLIIPPGGDWFVDFTLRRTLPPA